jgi:purine-binding chemotaxis protein CheW
MTDRNWEDVDQRLLKRRADELAKRLEQEDVSVAHVALLEFSLMGLSYAVKLGQVESVSKIGDIVSIPLTPRHFSGIIRRRGQSIALVNLRYFFHPNAEGIADADFALIVSVLGKRFALQVEDIQGVAHLEENRLLPPPDNFDPAQLPHVDGVTIEGLIVIDLESLVRTEGFGTAKSLQ